MEIGVTKAVQDKIKTKAVEITRDTPLVFCWDTHLVKLKGRNVLLIVNATDDANISITGLLPNGLIPVDTEFCIFVTSLVRRVTSEETLKWSIYANE